VDPDGLEPSHRSLLGSCTASRALGPVVRGAGVEPAMPEGAWVTTRSRPSTATRGRDRTCRGLVVPVTPIPLLAISSVFKVLFWRDSSSPFGPICASHSQGRGESNPVIGGFGGRPASGASPLRLLSVVVAARKTKEPLPCGSGSSTVNGPLKVQFIPLEAPPDRHLCQVPCCRRVVVYSLATNRATQPGSVLPRSAAGRGPGSGSRSTWRSLYTHL